MERRSSSPRRVKRHLIEAVRGLVLWCVTPLLAVTQLHELWTGRYGSVLWVQLLLQPVTMVLLLTLRRSRSRALVLAAYAMLMGLSGWLHYGPNPSVGLAILAGAVLVHLYHGWWGMVSVVGVGVAGVIVGGVAQMRHAGLYVPAAMDPRDGSNLARMALALVLVLSGLSIMLSRLIRGLEQSAEENRALLERERAERAERERADEARRQAELAMAEAQRQEVIARLAAGAAHDINNVLTAMLGSAELARMTLREDPAQAIEELDQIVNAGMRAATLTRQLLTFSQRQATRRREVLAGEVVLGLREMLKRLVPSTIELTIEDGSREAVVCVDPAQLEQVVLNLAVNARDAMPQGGALSVRVTRTRREAGQRAGVMIEVSDTGEGIAAELREEIFKPFFTTKPEGQGTGLGLATVATIVKDNGGRVELTSTPGEGTRFEVWLPAVVDGATESSRPISLSALRGLGERVLVVDDDGQVRERAARLLAASGYEVAQAARGEDALAQCAPAPSLILVDAVMPGLSGRALYEALRARAPQARFLFSTGYDAGGFGAGFFDDPHHHLLPKPYGRRELLMAVRDCLSGPAPWWDV